MSTEPRYLLAGVDGGGTGCRVAISTPGGTRLAEATGGPANYNSNPYLTIRSITAALDLAAERAGMGTGWMQGCTAHIGLAGVMSESDAQAVARAFPFASVSVSDDRVTSVAGALGTRDGMLAAIGTGTIIAGQKDHTKRFFGGWGHHLADQASGGWLGRNALRRTMLAYDGLATHSALTRALLARFDDDPLDMIAFVNKAAPGDFAQLARPVIEAARDGDATGRLLMQEGADYLRLCIETIGLGPEAVICLAGGIGPHYADHLPQEHRARLRPALGTALDGALTLAREAMEKQGGSA